MSPAPKEDPPVLTVDVMRQTLTARLLSSELTDDDRDFIRASLLYTGAKFCTLRASDRLRALLRSGR